MSNLIILLANLAGAIVFTIDWIQDESLSFLGIYLCFADDIRDRFIDASVEWT